MATGQVRHLYDEGCASLWWEGATYAVDVATLMWARFKELFFGKYFPADVRGLLTREFMSLRQGDLTVVEFIRKFDRSYHFVPIIVGCQSRAAELHGWIETHPSSGHHADEEGRKAADCLRNKGPTTGRAYVMHAEEAEAALDSTLITGRIYIAGVPMHALLDSGATHSFISESFVKRLGIIPVAMDSRFRVSIPSGDQMFTSRIVKRLELRLQKYAVHADLIVLPLPEFDIILGMD
ncbi:uncharacterized protein [Primulina huaijiensis]|uniref:uncharacterized protein n=1 Tax=Primulina huaijiensis TaxID=1492673 RepID=UPI003CC76380